MQRCINALSRLSHMTLSHFTSISLDEVLGSAESLAER
jgi:hypothetical protein